jgi:hypothetical protein
VTNHDLAKQGEDEADRGRFSQAVPLVGESHALSYALVMALASTPREEFSREEVDALCQLAYELVNKLTKAIELFHQNDKVVDPDIDRRLTDVR